MKRTKVMNATRLDGSVSAPNPVRFSGKGFVAHFGSSLLSFGKNSLVTPISTLYASPENSSSDLFCAFHPKRVTVPSLPFVFTDPLMPRRRFRPVGSDARLFLIVASVMLSINPRQNSGVGMRKIMLRVSEKSGCLILQPSGLSERPTIVKML